MQGSKFCVCVCVLVQGRDGSGVLSLWISQPEARGNEKVNDTLNISREIFSVP